MNTNQDRLDDAIDLVTARMTAVEADAALAARIASSLPERSVWVPRVWFSRFAIGALATIAIIVVLRVVNPAKAGHHSASATPPEAGHHGGSVTSAGARIAGVTPPVQVEPRGVSVGSAFKRTDSGTMADGPDHEFSLPAIEAVAALGMDPLLPASLPAKDALTIAPLEIADLPLTGEFPPR